MPTQSSATVSRIGQLRASLQAERYSTSIQCVYVSCAQRFIDYLENKSMALEAVTALQLEAFLRSELRSFRKRYARNPRDLRQWRRRYTSALHKLGRLLPGPWPVLAVPTTVLEAFHREVVQAYDHWLRELRGLAPVTRSKRVTQALRFLGALGPLADRENLQQLNVRDIDAYVQQRSMGLRRASIEGCTVCLRDFLRYLHGADELCPISAAP